MSTAPNATPAAPAAAAAAPAPAPAAASAADDAAKAKAAADRKARKAEQKVQKQAKADSAAAAAANPKPKAAAPARKLRLLCLHGYAQSESVFRGKSSALRRVLKSAAEFEIMQAPLALQATVAPLPTAAAAAAPAGAGGAAAAAAPAIDIDARTQVMRVKEWYGWHFPELARVIGDDVQYCRAVVHIRTREAWLGGAQQSEANAIVALARALAAMPANADAAKAAPDAATALAREAWTAATGSMGTALSDADADSIVGLARTALDALVPQPQPLQPQHQPAAAAAERADAKAAAAAAAPAPAAAKSGAADGADDDAGADEGAAGDRYGWYPVPSREEKAAALAAAEEAKKAAAAAGVTLIERAPNPLAEYAAGIEAVRAFVSARAAQGVQFDGLLGFSQGASMTALLSVCREAAVHAHAQGLKHEFDWLLPFRFVMLFAGFWPPRLSLRAVCAHLGLPVPATEPHGPADGSAIAVTAVDAGLIAADAGAGAAAGGAAAAAAAAPVPVTSLPSLHAFGTSDVVITAAWSQAAANALFPADTKATLTHGGAHFIPTNADASGVYREFLRARAAAASGGAQPAAAGAAASGAKGAKAAKADKEKAPKPPQPKAQPKVDSA